MADIGVVSWEILAPGLAHRSAVLLSLLWTLPTLFTNVTVTTLMAIKAWPSWYATLMNYRFKMLIEAIGCAIGTCMAIA